MRDVGEERTEREEELDPELLADVDDLGAERAPLQARLDTEEHDHVALAARDRRRVQLVGGPDDLARQAVGEAHLRTRGREVVELLGVDLGELAGRPVVAQKARRRGRGVGGVVPTLERGHQNRSFQLGAVVPVHVVH